jgi:transglutaminase-like putative cysteine protease
VKCWLPYPKENHPRQKDIYLLGVSNEDFIIAPDTCVHRTIYMESKAEKGKPVIFRISYSYTSSGQYFEPSSMMVLPYNTKSDLYRKYTSEQLPQICFTENVRQLADRITGDEKDPREIVKKIYYWFNRNIPWAGALEYSIMQNIPEYVLSNRKGDCGMQTFLFMSMLRYKGVPVKWQSGWMMPPESENLHDWCEIYYEGIGWVPADISYNLQYSGNLKTRDFYITGIDSYRLIVNDGVSGDLYPARKFLRSEPYDFQRGEVEWSGGNLYFDKWDYDMQIEYLPAVPAREGIKTVIK